MDLSLTCPKMEIHIAGEEDSRIVLEDRGRIERTSRWMSVDFPPWEKNVWDTNKPESFRNLCND
jgi:hypothetical protein